MTGSRPGAETCQQGHSLAEHGRPWKRTRRSRTDGRVLAVQEEIICRRCEADRNQRRRSDNPGHEYGMTAAQYRKLHQSQEGRCAICRRDEPLVVDHCHARLSVRGLLCRDCNLLLGNARDDVDVLTRAIEYLSREPDLAAVRVPKPPRWERKSAGVA
jgi:hypothetical protein